MDSGKWFMHRLRVRYEETDQMGVVYHANYLSWFEIGRTEMIRALGMPYRELERSGLLLPVVEAELKFSKPARYDDMVAVYTRIAAYSNVRLEFSSEVRLLSGEPVAPQLLSERVSAPVGDLLVSGGTKHMWLNAEWKPTRIDRAAPELYALLREAADEPNIKR